MTRVDFYVLEGAGEPLPFACRLIERVYRLRHTLYVRAADEAQARALDDLLWRFRAGAFVPHRRLGDAGEAPVWIGPEAEGPGEVLLNLADEVAPDPGRYARIAELVPADEGQRARAREHFRHYRAAGCTIEQHRLEV